MKEGLVETPATPIGGTRVQEKRVFVGLEIEANDLRGECLLLLRVCMLICSAEPTWVGPRLRMRMSMRICLPVSAVARSPDQVSSSPASDHHEYSCSNVIFTEFQSF